MFREKNATCDEEVADYPDESYRSYKIKKKISRSKERNVKNFYLQLRNKMLEMPIC